MGTLIPSNTNFLLVQQKLSSILIGQWNLAPEAGSSSKQKLNLKISKSQNLKISNLKSQNLKISKSQNLKISNLKISNLKISKSQNLKILKSQTHKSQNLKIKSQNLKSQNL